MNYSSMSLEGLSPKTSQRSTKAQRLRDSSQARICKTLRMRSGGSFLDLSLYPNCLRHLLPGIVPVPFQPPQINAGYRQGTVIQEPADLLH